MCSMCLLCRACLPICHRQLSRYLVVVDDVNGGLFLYDSKTKREKTKQEKKKKRLGTKTRAIKLGSRSSSCHLHDTQVLPRSASCKQSITFLQQVCTIMLCVCVSYSNETSGCEARKLLRNKSHSHHKLNNNKGNRQTRGTPCHPSTIRRFMSSISPSVRPSVIHHPFIHQQSINQPSTHPSSCLIQTHSTSQPTTDPSTRRKIMSSA